MSNGTAGGRLRGMATRLAGAIAVLALVTLTACKADSDDRKYHACIQAGGSFYDYGDYNHFKCVLPTT